MKFNIFGVFERIYKWIAYGSVLLISFVSVLYYLHLEEKSDTFIIGTLYALFLFIIGIYLTNMSNKIQNLYHRKKEQYLILKKLKDLFSLDNSSSSSSDEAIKFIISHRVFTGRTDGQTIEKAYIAQDGFSYKKDYLELEEKIYKQYGEILQVLNTRIKEYIDYNNLNKKVTYIHLHTIDSFVENIETWQQEYLDLSSIQQSEFFEFSDKLLKELKKAIRELKKRINKIVKMHHKYYLIINREIERMEIIFGDTLINDINFLDNLSYNLNVLEQLIKDIDRKLLLHSDIEEIEVAVSKLGSWLQDIDSKIDSIMEIVEAELYRDI